jgi:aminomethyltransferase
MSPAVLPLRRTPLTDIHVALGAKMVPYAGYLMPVHYPTGIVAEHLAVRARAGLFDVSHMGEFELCGRDAVAYASFVTSNDVHSLAVGQVQYSTILNERGTIEDDCLVYRLRDRVMLVVNAANHEKDWRRIASFAHRFDAEAVDVSNWMALLALQGPTAEDVLQRFTRVDLSAIGYYHFAEGDVLDRRTLISRTGYTGEDGFELYVANDAAVPIWEALTTSPGLRHALPAGLGARDTLRLEAGLALYGHEIDDTTTPFEAGLHWVVKLGKGDFVGRGALLAQGSVGPTRRLVGFTSGEQVFPRPGYPIVFDDVPVDVVRSGTVSPSLDVAIGTCYVPTRAADLGTPIEIVVRRRRVTAQVTPFPFYAHRTKRAAAGARGRAQ